MTLIGLKLNLKPTKNRINNDKVHEIILIKVSLFDFSNLISAVKEIIWTGVKTTRIPYNLRPSINSFELSINSK